MADATEGGLRNHRLEFVREDRQGEFPDDPSWNLYSDTVRSFEWSPDTNVEEQRGIGDADVSAFYKGAESHEVTVEYDLQQKASDGQTFLSGSDPNDAATDGTQRDVDNLPKNTHTVVDREDKKSITSGQTLASSGTRDTRIFTVGKGGVVDEVTFNGDPGSQNPVTVELSYQFEKVRSYQVDQPSGNTHLEVVSTEASDTSQSLTIGDEGASTTDTISLNGTTRVGTTNQFGDIDALELDTETSGNVEVYVSGNGDKLSELTGSNNYSETKGDLGIPTLGNGSHASAIGENYELIVGDSIERPAGTDLAFEINSVEISVSNNVESQERVDDLSMRLDAGGRDVELTATLLGESESHGKILEHLKVTENNVKWTLEGGSLQVDNAALTDPGSRTIDAGEAVMTLDTTFTGKGITVS